jgi:acetylornithine aminotransferase
MTAHVMNTYQRLPVSFEKGDGIYLWDEQGNQYLDALCGISVTSLGHNHPAVTSAITDQAAKLLHTSNIYHIANQEKLADLLCEQSGMERVFFGNSGAEANEAAIKLARLYGKQQDIKNPEIIVMQNSFHGRTWQRYQQQETVRSRLDLSRWYPVSSVCPTTILKPSRRLQ